MSGHQLPIDESEEMKRLKCKTEAALPTAWLLKRRENIVKTAFTRLNVGGF